MGLSIFPAITAKSRYATTLTSGTSYTVPIGVTYLNVTLIGGGGGGAGGPFPGTAGAVIHSTLAVTSGASITYAIGSGGSGGASGGNGNNGGTTTFTGATSAAGGTGGQQSTGTTPQQTAGGSPANGATATISSSSGVSGASGAIIVEYWL